MHERQPQRIRSYITRTQRLTARQLRGVQQGMPRYGWPPPHSGPDWTAVQSLPAACPCIFEIGFGMGEALLQMALAHPDTYYLGADVYLPGIGSLLAGLLEHRVNNVRIFRGDALTVLTQYMPDHCLDGVHLFFPDPWPKRRHHKRRIVNRPFLQLLAEKIKPGGYWHVATDWQPYAEAIQAVVATCSGWQAMTMPNGRIRPIRARPMTKYEARGLVHAHPIWEAQYRLPV